MLYISKRLEQVMKTVGMRVGSGLKFTYPDGCQNHGGLLGSYFLICKIRKLTRAKCFWTAVLRMEPFFSMKIYVDLQSIKQLKTQICWNIHPESDVWTLLPKCISTLLWSSVMCLCETISVNVTEDRKLPGTMMAELKEMPSTKMKCVGLSVTW